MNDNTHEEEEQTEGWLSDRIIDDWIATLLRDTEGDYQPMPGDKYKLSVSEIKRAKHGVKELDSCRSLIECKISCDIDRHVDESGVYATDNRYVRVIIPGLPAKYYIELSKLKMLLRECVIDTDIRAYSGGEVVLAVIEIDRKRLLKNLRVKRKK